MRCAMLCWVRWATAISANIFPTPTRVIAAPIAACSCARSLSVCRQRDSTLINADVTVLAEAPRVNPHRAAMAQNLAEDLQVARRTLINIKATTTEKLGFIGRKEGLAATGYRFAGRVTSSRDGHDKAALAVPAGRYPPNDLLDLERHFLAPIAPLLVADQHEQVMVAAWQLRAGDSDAGG